MSNDKYDQLAASYPGLFTGRWSTPTCGEGWYDVLAELVKNIHHLVEKEEDKSHFYISQVKEKLGGLRFYGIFPLEGQDLIREAQDKCEKICEVCGQPGKLDYKHEWYRTVCETHQKR